MIENLNFIACFLIVNAFDSIDANELKAHLDSQVHGATTEIIKITDFTIDGYLPKCFLPFYTPPGHLPRKVQIDRYVFYRINFKMNSNFKQLSF